MSMQVVWNSKFYQLFMWGLREEYWAKSIIRPFYQGEICHDPSINSTENDGEELENPEGYHNGFVKRRHDSWNCEPEVDEGG